MIRTIQNIWKVEDLRNRILFTLFILLIYRIGSFIPVPNINREALKAADMQGSDLFGLLNTFSGGALYQFSIFALGVMPYITASIVVQLGGTLYEPWKALKKEGESGRKKLNQYTRYLTLAITLVQGYLAVRGLESQVVTQGIQAVVMPGLLFEIAGTVSLVGGTLFLMWIGEQITSRGIGNGVSLIIMAGIVARLPQGIAQLLESGRTGSMSGIVVVGIVALSVLLITFICFMERAQRRVLIQYPKRQTVRGMQQERSHLPIKLNTAGVIPPIFASSLLLMPLTVIQWAGNRATAGGGASEWLITVSTFLQHGSTAYELLYGVGIVFFTFFYTAVQFNSEETADNLKRHGGFIPGIRPGKATEQYFDYLLNRITVVGAAYLAFICLVPDIAAGSAGLTNLRLGGTILLIVVNVTMDTVSQIQSHLIAHQYGDLIKKAKLKTAPRRR
jgi:preprotein translocase subunit SecY